jgi:hypothetical protein
LDGSSIFWKFLTTLMVRSVTSSLSRNDPLASSDDIRRRPDRPPCSAAAGLRDIDDAGAGAKRRCRSTRFLAAAAAAIWVGWVLSSGEGGRGDRRKRNALRRRGESFLGWGGVGEDESGRVLGQLGL